MTTQSNTMSYPRKLLNPMESMAVGCIGGTAEVLLQMPVITYKFCVQEGRALPSSFSGFYTGIGIQAGSVAPLTAYQMFLNSAILQQLSSIKNTTSLTDTDKMLCALTAGALSGPIYSFVDFALIHQQKLNKSLLQTASHISKSKGFLNFNPKPNSNTNTNTNTKH